MFCKKNLKIQKSYNNRPNCIYLEKNEYCSKVFRIYKTRTKTSITVLLLLPSTIKSLRFQKFTSKETFLLRFEKNVALTGHTACQFFFMFTLLLLLLSNRWRILGHALDVGVKNKHFLIWLNRQKTLINLASNVIWTHDHSV